MRIARALTNLVAEFNRLHNATRYWDDEHPEWGAEERAFAAAWRKQPKWVVSHLAHSLTKLGLIDEYRIYLHPVVLGQGTPFFAGPRPLLRLKTSDRIDEDVIRLIYVPA